MRGKGVSVKVGGQGIVVWTGVLVTCGACLMH
jgi:hypothetical protein